MESCDPQVHVNTLDIAAVSPMVYKLLSSGRVERLPSLGTPVRALCKCLRPNVAGPSISPAEAHEPCNATSDQVVLCGQLMHNRAQSAIRAWLSQLRLA